MKFRKVIIIYLTIHPKQHNLGANPVLRNKRSADYIVSRHGRPQNTVNQRCFCVQLVQSYLCELECTVLSRCYLQHTLFERLYCLVSFVRRTLGINVSCPDITFKYLVQWDQFLNDFFRNTEVQNSISRILCFQYIMCKVKVKQSR